MKKRLVTLATAVGLVMALSIPVGAADLHEPHTDMTFDCAGGVVTLHFVNNQTGGAAAGTITVLTSNPTDSIVAGPSKVNRNVQHFFVDIEGDATLDDASTNLDGRLVLSDYECDPGKKGKK